jgi:hypothetical protein
MAQATIFLLTPAHQTQNQALNFQEKRDTEIYNKGCDSLPGDPYDGTNLSDFLSRPQAKADQYGQGNIINVTLNNQQCNLLTDYVIISRKDVLVHMLAFNQANDRCAQNSSML